MQKIKHFSGNVVDHGVTESRICSYGNKSASGKADVYINKVNLVNEIIASFLRDDCGVDAEYTTKSGSLTELDFLWIYGFPVLYAFIKLDNKNNLFLPDTGSSSSYKISSASEDSSLFKSTTTPDYSFDLIFTGSPDAFALRMTSYKDSNVDMQMTLRIIRATNILNNKDAILCGVSVNSSSGSNMASDAVTFTPWSVDISDGILDVDTISPSKRAGQVVINTQSIDFELNPNKIILQPIFVAPYQTKGLFYRPVNFNLPNATPANIPLQTEIEMAGRRFIITNSDSGDTKNITMGMIEVTEPADEGLTGE